VTVIQVDERLGSGDQSSALQISEETCEGRFAEMAERNARFMYRVAFGLLRSVQDAEDAVQEALLKLYRGDSWMRMEDERAFLARTVWRVGLDVAARRPQGSEPVETGEGELAATGATPEQSAVSGDESALLRKLIEALPEELRQPLVLSAIEEMTSREVAVAMGIPEGTVRTRVMRAKAELKRRFEAMRLRQTRTNAD
jgi:RNA polymerase sigma-70 factor (ECF subfamily)